jgi:hypothetical protein
MAIRYAPSSLSFRGSRSESPEPINTNVANRDAAFTLRLNPVRWRLWVPGSALRAAPE